MKLIHNTETFDKHGEDFIYKENVIFYSDGTSLFLARTSTRYSDDEINFSELQASRIPAEHVYPKFDPDFFTVAPDPIPRECYLKGPYIFMYYSDASDPYQVSEGLKEEAKVCEQLLKFPHRNLASYLGCQVKDGRISGLYFKRYKQTMLGRVDRNPEQIDQRKIIDEIQSGLEHLHSIGYCHNDICPGNIMFDEHDVAIIIDFDSARPMGQELTFKGGTPGYQRENNDQSVKENDYYSLAKIKEFLDESCSVN